VVPVVDATPPPALGLQQEVLVCDDVHQTDVSDSARVTQSKAAVRALRRRGLGAARRKPSALSERLSAGITTPAAAGLRTEWRALPVALGIHCTPTYAGADSIAVVSLEHSRALALSVIGPRGGLPPRQSLCGGFRCANRRASGR
jgi:hypothetical protein